jgi:hypothetical protein
MSIEAMRQALEVLDSFEPLDQKLWMLEENIDVDKTIKALREAIAEAEKREWVGLTEDEIDDIWNKYCDEMGEASINDAQDIGKAIEAKLKEKNT